MRDDGGLDQDDNPSDEEKKMNSRCVLEKEQAGLRTERIAVKKEAKTILTLLSILIWVDRSWCHFLKTKRMGEKSSITSSKLDIVRCAIRDTSEELVIPLWNSEKMLSETFKSASCQHIDDSKYHRMDGLI